MNANKKSHSNVCYELRKKCAQLFGNSEIVCIVCDINFEKSFYYCLPVPFQGIILFILRDSKEGCWDPE